MARLLIIAPRVLVERSGLEYSIQSSNSKSASILASRFFSRDREKSLSKQRRRVDETTKDY